MRNFTIRTAIMAMLVVILVALVGCGILEKVSLGNLNKDKVSQTAKDKNATQSSDVSDLEAIPDTTVLDENTDQSKDKTNNDKTSKEKGSGQVSNNKMEITLYFANEKGDKLVAEKRAVSKETGIARKAIEELIAGPKDSELRKTMPAGTKLLDIAVDKEGLATVSFSKEIENHLNMAYGEQMTIYSIVNTLTEFPTINKVQLQVDGKNIQTLAGHANVSKPYERNTKIIE